MNNSYVTVCALDAIGLQGMVRRGRELADQSGCALRILLFQQLQRHFRENADILEYAFQCAKSADAGVEAFYTSDETFIKQQMLSGSEKLVVRGDEARLLRLSGDLPPAKLEIYRPENRADYAPPA